MVLIGNVLGKLVGDTHAHEKIEILETVHQSRNLLHIPEAGLASLTGVGIQDIGGIRARPPVGFPVFEKEEASPVSIGERAPLGNGS
jgi:hypothetical protein